MDMLSLSRPLILLLVFGSVILVTITLLLFVDSRRAVRRRLVEQVETVAAHGTTSLRTRDSNSAWVKLVDLVERRGLSLADTKDDQLRKRMVAAGFPSPAAPRIYTFSRLALTLGLPILFITGSYALGRAPSMMSLYFISAGLALLGLYLPNVLISGRIDRRQTALRNAMPDALDLMLVCVEAGLGIEAAFDRVGRELVRTHPLLSEMLGVVVLEMRAGRSREDALRRMGDRAGLDDIRAFSTLLIQSSKLGSSIGQTLRTYALEMREKRRMRAEEKAHRLPVIISLPLVGCLLPVMIGVLILPAAIRVIRQILPAMSG